MLCLLQVLVEYDDLEWTKREWIRISEVFQVFLVENTLLWAPRDDPVENRSTEKILWPALVSINDSK